MQADEIIQQKEWGELTESEKEILFELASTEQEYNLVKKMLQVSVSESEEVPLIGKHVRNELHAELPKGKVRSMVFYKYAAAAAVLIAILTGVIFLNRNKNVDGLVKNDTLNIKTKQATIVRPPAVPANDTIILLPKNIAPVPKQAIAKIIPSPALQPVLVDPVPPEPVYAVVNTSVKSQEVLLDLVTEIY